MENGEEIPTQSEQRKNDKGRISIKLSKWRLALAFGLVLLSMISKGQIGPVEFTGGTALVALAALIILWPIIQQLAYRGGSTEILGLKVQINSLEKKAEEEFGIRIEELRADVEELRAALGPRNNEYSADAAPEPHFDDRIFLEAVAEYNAHRHFSEWQSRVEADKRLATIAGTLPVSYLREALEKSPSDQGVAMAVAVVLGSRQIKDEVPSAELLVELLSSPYERARYRAARSVERRGKRADITSVEREILLNGLNQASIRESAQVVRNAFESARQALTGSYYK